MYRAHFCRSSWSSLEDPERQALWGFIGEQGVLGIWLVSSFFVSFRVHTDVRATSTHTIILCEPMMFNAVSRFCEADAPPPAFSRADLGQSTILPEFHGTNLILTVGIPLLHFRLVGPCRGSNKRSTCPKRSSDNCEESMRQSMFDSSADVVSDIFPEWKPLNCRSLVHASPNLHDLCRTLPHSCQVLR